jgi:tetratricopeptide (TPR) repeat protein
MARIEELLQLADEAAKSSLDDQELAYLEEVVGTAQANLGDLMRVPQQAAEALDQTSMGLYKLSRGDMALAAVNYAISLYPNFAPALQHKAIILISMNRDVALAYQLLDQALAIAPHDKNIWASKGDAMKILGNTQDAIECYLQAQQLDVASTQYVDRALKLEPKHPRALQMKLAISIRTGGTAEAISTCEQLIASNPQDSSLYFTLANLLTDAGRLDEALACVDRALDLTPDHPIFLFGRARILRKMDRIPEAFALLKSLLDKRVEVDSGTLLEAADALEMNPIDPGLLLAVRTRLLEVDPRNLANLQALRSLAISRGDKPSAIRASEAWLALSPQNLEAERALAELLKDVGDVDRALAMYAEIARFHPAEVLEIRNGLNLAHDRQLNEKLVYFAQVVLAQEPKDATTMEWLADALTKLGRAQEALQVTDNLLKIDPEKVAYLRRKKACLTALGRHSDVPPIMDKIFEMDATAYDIAMERARLYFYWAEHAPAGSDARDRWAREALRSFERGSLSTEFRSECFLGSAKVFHLIRNLDKAEESYARFLALPENVKRGDIQKERGHVLREMSRNAEALDAYQKAVELGCEDTDLLWGLVEVLRSLNQESKALHYLEILVQREPHNPLYLRRHGRLLMQVDKKQEGLAELKKALSLQERDPAACFELADAYKETGAYQDAVTYYQQGLRLDPQNQLARLSFAEALILTGRIPEAVNEVDQILRRDPSSLRAWRLRRDAFRSLKRDQDVLYSLKAILVLNPADAQALEEKYRIHLSRGEKEEAYEAIQALIKMSPQKAGVAELYLMRGDLASDLGKEPEALSSYEEAVKADPNVKFEATYRKARTFSSRGKYEDAMKVLEDFGNPPFPKDVSDQLAQSVLTLRGVASFHLEHFTEALDYFSEAAKKDPRNSEAALWKAKSLLELGKHREARDFLTQVLPTISLPTQDFYLALAEAEAGIGSLDAAVAACLKGLELFPASGLLLVRLGDLRTRQERWQEAADAYARAIGVDKTNAELYIKMGAVHEKLEHPHEAIKVYEEATRLAPNNPHAHLRLGLVLLDTGQPEDALRSIEAALKLDPHLESASEAKAIAIQKTREKQIESFAKSALLLSSQMGRAVGRNDLFMNLKVPWDLLDPVMREISKVVDVDLSKLTEKEVMDFEGMSYNLIITAFQKRLSSIEGGNLTLADVASLSPPDYSLAQIQRLFGYVQSVVSMPMKPDQLKLTPEVEEMARRAMTFPPEERTPFHLVKNLRIGLYKAMVIKAVETMSMDSRTSLPSVSFAPAPQQQQPPPPPPAGPPSPEPKGAAPSQQSSPASETTTLALTDAPAGARCAGCGGPAAYTHACGAYICRHCIVQFASCPKCSLTLTLPDGGSGKMDEKPGAMEVPVALLPASKRVEESESASDSQSSSRIRRLLQRSRQRPTTTSPTSTPETSDKDDHL